jgi:hypothetical protein
MRTQENKGYEKITFNTLLAHNYYKQIFVTMSIICMKNISAGIFQVVITSELPYINFHTPVDGAF